jgi:hypothetical protein
MNSLQPLVPPLRLDPPERQPKSSDLMGVLAELEGRFPVEEWQVSGLHIWPLLRQRWFFREWAAHYVQPGAPAAGSASSGFFAQAAAGALAAAQANWRDPAGHDRAIVRRDLVFLSDGVSFARLGGQWVERFCDPLIALANRRGLTSALWTPLHKYHQPRFTPSRFVQSSVDGANLWGALRGRLWPPDAVLPGNVAMAQWLAGQGFGSGALSRAKVVSDACRLRGVADRFKRMLDRVRPRLAFLVSFYGVEGMSFVLACRECGVPVVDIQHGVQGELHPAYAAWKMPPDRDRHALLPDRFWVWSDWERNVIERWSAGTGHAAVIGGNPWMDLWRKGSRWTGVGEALAQAQGLRDRAHGRPIVLVTLQFGLSPAEQLEPLANLLQAAGTRLCFWVRLHPAMLERRAEIRARLRSDATVELDECSDLPLQALLPHCDLHLTHSSSTVIEAAQFGVPSVLTTAYGGELFAPLVAAGRARVITGDAAQLARALVESAAGFDRQATPEPPAEAALDQLLATSPLSTTRKFA